VAQPDPPSFHAADALPRPAELAVTQLPRPVPLEPMGRGPEGDFEAVGRDAGFEPDEEPKP
jgi:hypothetical protein